MDGSTTAWPEDRGAGRWLLGMSRGGRGGARRVVIGVMRQPPLATGDGGRGGRGGKPGEVRGEEGLREQRKAKGVTSRGGVGVWWRSKCEAHEVWNLPHLQGCFPGAVCYPCLGARHGADGHGAGDESL